MWEIKFVYSRLFLNLCVRKILLYSKQFADSLTDVSQSTWAMHKTPVTYSHVFFSSRNNLFSALRSNDVDAIAATSLFSSVRFHDLHVIVISCYAQNCKILFCYVFRYFINYLHRCELQIFINSFWRCCI